VTGDLERQADRLDAFTSLFRNLKGYVPSVPPKSRNVAQARLQIDTGASGLLISRSVADHAGLKQFSRDEVAGIGNQGTKATYSAFADDIKLTYRLVKE